jgi:peptidoglycan/LPS O-acetylase OafA/YrhL
LANVERDERRVFLTLDGLRGVAAVFVAMRHTAFFHSLGIHGGYMAVDLFFVLSGFVIAHAYERRLAAGMGAGRFLVLRYLRLWPVYLIGACLGLAAALCHALPGRDNLSPDEVARVAPFALAMLPGPHIRPMLYPVDSVAWSLALELIINLAYALTWRWLGDVRVLAGLTLVAAGALAWTVSWYGKLDVGFTWSNAPGGLARVAFSFTAGLLLHRAWRRWPLNLRLTAWAPLALLPALFWRPTDTVVYPLACVIAVFPALVMLSAWTQPGRRSARLFAWLGAASYPLYAIHRPAGELIVLGLSRVIPASVHWGVWLGAPYMVAALAVCVFVERYYDRPVRGALTRAAEWLMRQGPRRARRAAVVEPEALASEPLRPG